MKLERFQIAGVIPAGKRECTICCRNRSYKWAACIPSRKLDLLFDRFAWPGTYAGIHHCRVWSHQ